MTERGEEIKDYKGKRIEYIDANIIDNITEEDLYTARDEEEAPTEQLQDGSTQPAHNINIQEIEKAHVNNKEETERLQSLRLDIEGAKDIIGAEQFNNIIQENFRKPLEQLTVGQLEMAKSLINSSLDNQGGF